MPLIADSNLNSADDNYDIPAMFTAPTITITATKDINAGGYDMAALYGIGQMASMQQTGPSSFTFVKTLAVSSGITRQDPWPYNSTF